MNPILPEEKKSYTRKSGIKIDIAKLTTGASISTSQEYPPESLDLEMPEVKFRGGLRLEATAENKNGTIIVTGAIFLPLLLNCSHCLCPYAYDLKQKFFFDYAYKKSDVFIDISEDIRSEIILTYSATGSCSPDCNGLCLKCGEDLNQGKCGCKI